MEITNQRFSLKYQMFRQLAAAFISGSGLQSVHVLTSGISKKSLVRDFRKRTLSDATQLLQPNQTSFLDIIIYCHANVNT